MSWKSQIRNDIKLNAPAGAKTLRDYGGIMPVHPNFDPDHLYFITTKAERHTNLPVL